MDELNRRRFINSIAATSVGFSASARPAFVQGQILSRLKTSGSVFKSLAIADYHQNMKAFGGALANHPSRLFDRRQASVPWQFEIAVIGSGYGAAITAARLSQRLRPGGRLCLIERGREWVPGTFPDVPRDVTDETRLKIFGPKKRSMNNPTGLFNVLQGKETSIVSGSGLGGSSLINARIAIKPDPDVFYQTQ
jgi:cholesterol oxidase